MSSSWSSSSSSPSLPSALPITQVNPLHSVEQSQRAPSSDPRDNSSGAILTEIEPEASAPPAPLSETGSSPSTGSYVHVDEEKEVVEEVVVAEVEVIEVVAEVEKVQEKGDDPPEPTLAV